MGPRKWDSVTTMECKSGTALYIGPQDYLYKIYLLTCFSKESDGHPSPWTDAAEELEGSTHPYTLTLGHD